MFISHIISGASEHRSNKASWERLGVKHAGAGVGGTPRGRPAPVSRGTVGPLSPAKNNFPPSAVWTSKVENPEIPKTHTGTKQLTYHRPHHRPLAEGPVPPT